MRPGSINSYAVTRAEEATLPETSMAISRGGPGYSCSHLIGYAEEIGRGGAMLTSQQVDRSTPRWSPGFVKKYLAENGVDGPGYFRCLDVLEALQFGSLETLGTTTITRSMLK